MFLFTNTIIASTAPRMRRQADRIDVLRQSGYPEVVIEWSKNLAPSAAQKYADLPAIMLSRMLKEKGLKITRYNRDQRVKEFVLSVINEDTYLAENMRMVLDSVAWIITKGRPLNFDFYNSSQSELVAWADEMHEYIEMVSVSDPEKYTGPVVVRLEDGWTINELTAEDCEIEGALMKHCVAGYARDVQNGRSRIFSLRDPRGLPHVTMEFEVKKQGENEPAILRLVQSKGRSNASPKEEYVEMISDWLRNFEDPNIKLINALEDTYLDDDFAFSTYQSWDTRQYEDHEADYGIDMEKPDDPLKNIDFKSIVEGVGGEMNQNYADDESILYGVHEYIYDHRNHDEFTEYLRDVADKWFVPDTEFKKKWLENRGQVRPDRSDFVDDEEYHNELTRYELALQTAPEPAGRSEESAARIALEILNFTPHEPDEKSYVPGSGWLSPSVSVDNFKQQKLPFAAANYILLR